MAQAPVLKEIQDVKKQREQAKGHGKAGADPPPPAHAGTSEAEATAAEEHTSGDSAAEVPQPGAEPSPQD